MTKAQKDKREMDRMVAERQARYYAACKQIESAGKKELDALLKNEKARNVNYNEFQGLADADKNGPSGRNLLNEKAMLEEKRKPIVAAWEPFRQRIRAIKF